MTEKKDKPISFGISSKKYTQEEIANSRAWLKDELKNISKVGTMSALRQRRGDTEIGIGKMVFFKYDPKYADILPFYDTFPLVIVIDIYKGGFLGLNLHYIPPNLRALFLGKLFDVLNNHKMDGTTKLKITYELLKGATQYKYFRPTIKRYLVDHVKSNISVIRPSMWPQAIMLPVAKWKKSSENAVYSHSKTLI